MLYRRQAWWTKAIQRGIRHFAPFEASITRSTRRRSDAGYGVSAVRSGGITDSRYCTNTLPISALVAAAVVVAVAVVTVAVVAAVAVVVVVVRFGSG